MLKNTSKKGFTLIETLVAITILTVAVAAPLSLAAQSLLAAFNARDQVTAFHLAQEAIETVRAQRDKNLLEIIKTGVNVAWLGGLEVEERNITTGDIEDEKPFMVDSISTSANFASCTGSVDEPCARLQFDEVSGFYGHIFSGRSFTKESRFTRIVRITEVANTNKEEVIVRSEVQWRTGRLGGMRSVVVEENLFKWIAGVTNPVE